jgi:selenocysteine lyase/cysteine desulfurase
VVKKGPSDSFSVLADRIRRQEVGAGTCVRTPFGSRRIYYADLTATGRHLSFVEEWVARLRPYYANTHTEVSTTGRVMSGLRQSAREVIGAAVNAGDDDEVLFVGSGATAAINKLVGLLGLRRSEPPGSDRKLGRPVVFVGPYEHHSNELPWLESIAEVVEIALDPEGAIDVGDLEKRLREYAERPMRIGSFSAASNVTGLLSDVPRIARVLHGAGALALFDYAAAAPYVPIDMHPPAHDERIDALFISPHKFVGGPEASGVLVAHRSLFRMRTPERPGGGTVDYVAGPRRADVDYVRHLAEREEGGTPAILGDIRAGLAFLVKEMLGPEQILAHETSVAARAAQRLARHPAIDVLGPSGGSHLAIVPIVVEGLHHDLVSTLLDDLFGIQTRSGCSCAGPYGHALLGIDVDVSGRFRALVRRGVQGIKPGWTRISIPHYATDDDLEFLLSAIELVASHGHDFVPLYRFGWRDGVWRHVEHPAPNQGTPEMTLESLFAMAGTPRAAFVGEAPTESELASERARYFSEARELAQRLRDRWRESPPAWNPPTGDADVDELAWFRFVHSDPPDPGRDDAGGSSPD